MNVSGGNRPIRSLTPRERQVVQCVARGFTNQEISETLRVGPQTAKNHMHNLFEKLGVSDRVELALLALRKGLDLDTNVLHFGPVRLADVVVVGAPSQMEGAKVHEGVVEGIESPTGTGPTPTRFPPRMVGENGGEAGGGSIHLHRCQQEDLVETEW